MVLVLDVQLEADVTGLGRLDTGVSRFGTGLAVIAVVAGLWRLAYLFAAKWGDELLLNDSLYFSLQAALNSEGEWFREGLNGQPGA